MRIEAVCFTQRGQELGAALISAWDRAADQIALTRCGGQGPTLAEWTAAHFAKADALLFIGAAGIAVRAIAPYVRAKSSDPAVIVMDEAAQYAIALLSGHIGGANRLAERLAAVVGAEPVITTATDVNGCFAVDSWAVEQGFRIQNPERIKMVSAKLLAGQEVSLFSEFFIEGGWPEGLIPVQEAEAADIVVSVRRRGESGLSLTSPALVLGVGCRKGIAEEDLEAGFAALCDSEQLESTAFCGACSIDIKRDEPGLLAFCQSHGWSLDTYTAAALAAVQGVFSHSDFVEKTTGVDNVCERAAVLGSGGTLLVGKTCGRGVTMAVAVKEETLSFEGWI